MGKGVDSELYVAINEKKALFVENFLFTNYLNQIFSIIYSGTINRTLLTKNIFKITFNTKLLCKYGFLSDSRKKSVKFWNNLIHRRHFSKTNLKITVKISYNDADCELINIPFIVIKLNGAEFTVHLIELENNMQQTVAHVP